MKQNNDLEALKAQRDEIDRRIKILEDERIEAAKTKMQRRILNITPIEKSAILEFVEHTAAGCSDKRAINGWSEALQRCQCPKCMLIEILNGEHGGEFSFTLQPRIYKTKG